MERELIIQDFKIAGNFWMRLKGLMFSKSLAKNQGILFLNCSRVHTFFMKFDICVIYLDKDFNIIFHEILKPGKLGKKIKDTKHLIEASIEVVPYIKHMTKVVLRMEEIDND